MTPIRRNKKQKQEYRLVAIWLKPELLAQIDARANGNRSEFIRLALAEYIKRS
jgi:metal-responsive CopG/Arc/MetJ family transcriptional regulator